MKYLVIMFGLWMTNLAVTEYLKQQVSVCPVTIHPVEAPRVPYRPADNLLEQPVRGITGTPVVYRF